MLHHHIQAFDEERNTNFDEVWDEELVPALLDEKKYKEYWGWLSQIELETSENQGEIENPRTLTLPIGSDITLTIEYHPCCTYYFLNDTLIGEVSGNFHLKYLTYSELMRITKKKYGDILFHLLLPLSVITLNPQLHSRSATYIKRNGLLIRKITIKSSRPFQCAYHPLTP